VKRTDPLKIRDLGGRTARLPAGWRFAVVDLERLPSQQIVFVGDRASHPEALEAACERIKILTEVGG
jgi:hypothetical protein